jgi:hypothetical protein
MVVIGTDSADTMSLMMLVQLMPEAKPDMDTPLVLEVADMIFSFCFFYACRFRL